MLTKWMLSTVIVCVLSVSLPSCQTTPSGDAPADLRSGSSTDLSQMRMSDAGPDSGVRDAGPDSVDAGGGDMSPSAPPPRLCAKGCRQASDCATDTGAFSADNYSCQAGVCKYLGCFTTSECATSYGAGYVCPSQGTGLKTCAKGCSRASDCSTGNGAYGVDRYTCQDGACQYLGCTTDGQCATSFGAAYVCGGVLTLPDVPMVRACTLRCTQASDCALNSGAYSADNYSCTANACRYLGCFTNDECVSSNGAGYVCP